MQDEFPEVELPDHRLYAFLSLVIAKLLRGCTTYIHSLTCSGVYFFLQISPA